MAVAVETEGEAEGNCCPGAAVRPSLRKETKGEAVVAEESEGE